MARDPSRSCLVGAVLLTASLLLVATAGSGGARAAEPATGAQLFVGSGEGYSIAFEVQGSAVSVLGLDARVFCSFTEPRESLGARLNGFFPVPTLMSERPSGLTARESDGGRFGGEEATITATFDGARLVGEFNYRRGDDSYHCQSGGYYLDAPSRVFFEAVRWVPVTDPRAITRTPGESAVYFARASPIEVFLRVDGGRVYVRGSVASSCHFGGEDAAVDPLFASPTDPVVDPSGGFRDSARYGGAVGENRRFFEPVLLSGIVGEDSIAGFYSRTRVIAEGTRVQHRCGTRSLPFTADRYVPELGTSTAE